VDTEPLSDCGERFAVYVERRGLCDLYLREAAAAASHASPVHAFRECLDVRAERRRRLLECESAVVGSDDRVEVSVIEANLGLFASS
jgi:hypothetical protein